MESNGKPRGSNNTNPLMYSSEACASRQEKEFLTTVCLVHDNTQARLFVQWYPVSYIRSVSLPYAWYFVSERSILAVLANLTAQVDLAQAMPISFLS